MALYLHKVFRMSKALVRRLFLIMCSFLLTASKKKRNFVLDQTNVYPSARRRKMRNFKGFIRRAAIIVPDDSELKRRSDKRTYEDGK